MLKLKSGNRITYIKKSEIESVEIYTVKEKIDCDGVMEDVDFLQVSIITKSGHFYNDNTLYDDIKTIEQEYDLNTRSKK